MGNAVVRNRMKRRAREAVRLQLPGLAGGVAIVINPRKPILLADFQALQAEVKKLFEKCANY